MKKLSAAEQRLIENATLMGASHIIFKKLQDIGIVNYQLGKLIVMSSGESLTTSQMDDSLPYPVYGGGGLVGYYSRYLFDSPKIVIGRVGARCGCVFVTEHKAWVTDNALVVTKTSNLVDDGYLVHALRYLNLRQQANQAAQPVISQKNINLLLIPVPSIEVQKSIDNFLNVVERRQQENKSEILPSLPSPLGAIRRIVARIEELAAKVAEARGLRRQSIEEAEVLLNASAFKAFTKFDSKNLVLIESICEVKGGIQKSSDRTPGANPRRYITVAHVQRNWIDTGDPRYFEVSDEELERWRLLSGDVLIIEGNGSADHIGRTALFTGEIEDCVHQNHVIRVRPNQSKLMPEYLNTYLNSPLGRDQMLKLSRTTSGLFTLSVGRIKSIKISAPPLPEQRHIVVYLNNLHAKVDALKRLQTETAAEMDALLPSILDKAFKGEL